MKLKAACGVQRAVFWVVAIIALPFAAIGWAFTQIATGLMQIERIAGHWLLTKSEEYKANDTIRKNCSEYTTAKAAYCAFKNGMFYEDHKD